jgi:hypothetical protein
MIDITISDDYGVLTTPDYGFYFGYEFDIVEDEDGDTDDVWGFEVNGNEGTVFRISYEDMQAYANCPNMSDVSKCLLFGIGLFIKKYIPEDIGDLSAKTKKCHETTKQIADKNTMVFINDKNFHCACGGNVFTKYSDDTFKCNSCDTVYDSEKGGII